MEIDISTLHISNLDLSKLKISNFTIPKLTKSKFEIYKFKICKLKMSKFEKKQMDNLQIQNVEFENPQHPSAFRLPTLHPAQLTPNCSSDSPRAKGSRCCRRDCTHVCFAKHAVDLFLPSVMSLPDPPSLLAIPTPICPQSSPDLVRKNKIR